MTISTTTATTHQDNHDLQGPIAVTIVTTTVMIYCQGNHDSHEHIAMTITTTAAMIHYQGNYDSQEPIARTARALASMILGSVQDASLTPMASYHPKFIVKLPRVAKDNRPVADRIQVPKDLCEDTKLNIQIGKAVGLQANRMC
ncbi:hypothetical protein BGX34_002307 [Mortierella sp. NVP85]|nr:hypothetical protein BGX34_002307 [Mortierella sp. NVP85]